MPFPDFIRDRRSTRRFTKEPVGEPALRELIELALWSPSPHNAEPWRFVLVSPAFKHALAVAMADRLGDDMVAEGLAITEIRVLQKRSIDRLESAPNCILVGTVDDGLKLNSQPQHDELERRMATQSVGAVLQTFFLAAHERGIGTCWMAAPMYCPDVVRKVLDLPGEFRPEALILVGYPRQAGQQRPRQDLDTVVIRR